MSLPNNIKIILLIGLTIGALALSSYLGYGRKKQVSLNLAHNQTSSPTSLASNPTATPKIDTSDWNTYRNEKYGFEFKYPFKNWTVVEGPADINIEHIIPQTTLEDAGITISIVESLAKENLDSFLQSPYEGPPDNSDNQPPKEFIKEVIIDGYRGYKAREGSAGIIFLEKDKNSSFKIEIGYSGLSTSESDIDLEMCPSVKNINDCNKIFNNFLDKILSTFKFIKTEAVTSLPENMSTEDWKTYKNENYGFEFKYPSNLKLKPEFEGDYLFQDNVWSISDNDNSSGTPIINIPLYEIYKADSFVMKLRIGVNSTPEKVTDCLKFNCSDYGKDEDCVSKKNINGTDFVIFPIEDGGMSHYLHGKSYRTIHGNSCFAIEQVNFGTTAGGDIDPEQVQDYSNQGTDAVNKILSTFKFTKSNPTSKPPN